MTQRVLLVMLLFYSFMALAADTVLKLYRPFNRDDGQQLLIHKQINGECSGQSKLILREDAWSCQADGQIYDPCFIKSGPNQMSLLCPNSPWSNENVQINVASPLSNEEHQVLDMSRTYPWAIELTNGDHCQAIELGESYDSMPVRYHCSGENRLVGTIQRCNPVWSMLEKTPDGVVTRELKQAWF
ncbi:hypothetical protein [Legionella sp. km772]|uniref:hypothetical protein n=1 Tax=Legionella sp. km772 TaxID=2498111 RepID=UPI000F8DC577|nr:hypothetical protein [Legionella sp. km772]RUR12053.1 hypothetical protein ELY15_06310 [Legionella sp. km772]